MNSNTVKYALEIRDIFKKMFSNKNFRGDYFKNRIEKEWNLNEEFFRYHIMELNTLAYIRRFLKEEGLEYYAYWTIINKIVITSFNYSKYPRVMSSKKLDKWASKYHKDI